MTLPLPNLDDRSFADLVAEARTLLPRYAPGWTNYNEADPGITIVDLLAWLTEMQLYRVNQLRDANTRIFLGRLGVVPEADEPLGAATERALAGLKRIDRAITGKDFEALATASGNEYVGTIKEVATVSYADRQAETRLSLDAPVRLTSSAVICSKRRLSPITGTLRTPPGPALTGLNTRFRADLIEDDELLLPDGETTRVSQILSDTALILASPVPYSQEAISLDRIVSPAAGKVYTGSSDLTRLRVTGPSLAGDVHSGDVVSLRGIGKRVVVGLSTDDTGTEITLDLALPEPIVQPGVELALVTRIGLARTQPSSALIGSGTAFTMQLKSGDILSIPGLGVRTVNSVESDTLLSLDQLVGIDAPGVAVAKVETLALTANLRPTGMGASTAIYAEGTDLAAQVLSGDIIVLSGAGVSLDDATDQPAGAQPNPSPSILRARAFVPSPQRPWMGVVILPAASAIGLSDSPTDHTDLALRAAFDSRLTTRLLDQAKDQLDLVRPLATRVYVLAPEVVPIRVHVRLKGMPGEPLAGLSARAETRLRTFLDPYVGGDAGTGWPFGRSLYRSELYQLLETTPGVDVVQELFLNDDRETDAIPLSEIQLFGAAAVTVEV